MNPIKDRSGQLALDLEDPYGGEVLKCKSVEVLSLGLQKALFLEIELAEPNDGWRFHVAASVMALAHMETRLGCSVGNRSVEGPGRASCPEKTLFMQPARKSLTSRSGGFLPG